MKSSIENKLSFNYWTNKLKSCPVVNDRSLSIMETEGIIISNDDLSYFNKLTGNNFAAKFTVLISIYNVLLKRYFDSSLFIASSELNEKENTLLYECSSLEGKTFKQLLNEFKIEINNVLKYSNFEELDIVQNPFSKYTHYGFSFDCNGEKNTFPFYLCVNNIEKGLTISISYDSHFTSEYIANHFLRNVKLGLLTLENCIDEDTSKFKLLSRSERGQVLYSFNNTHIHYPKDNTIVSLFEEQAEKTPDNVAVLFEDIQLTYKELNEQSNQLAHFLRDSITLEPNDLVGIKLERNEQLLVAILGVLKSGAAYVPIDTNYPKERIDYIEKDSNCKLVLDREYLEQFSANTNTYSVENLQNTIDSSDLAYVIYTSGTTGNPKGVMIMHSNAVAMLIWACREFDDNKFDVAYAATSHCFDLSIFEMFYPLSIGKKIKLFENALSIGDELEQDTNVLINTVPSSIRHIIDSGISLDNAAFINLAGEPFPVDIAKKLLTTNAEIRNLYGPSEDTTYSTGYTLSRNTKYETSIPIGKPISNSYAYILENNLDPLPIGVTGKLYLSGAGIVKGYLNKEELTSKRFVENPFIVDELMYDTGDLARWMPDGNIEFLGRDDNQVKIRGYRIELEEIENSIALFSDDIKQVVLNVDESKKEKELVAYFSSKNDIEKSELRDFLLKRLPSYMVPNYYIVLDSIPLTPNGKIDKKSLPGITSEGLVKKEYIAPTNEVEKQIVGIWEEVLGVKKIGTSDNFFELGGHSLLVGQIINRIYKQLEKSITFKSFFESPTIKEISNELSNRVYNPIPQLKTRSYYPLTTSQNRLWILSQLEGGDVAYNMPDAVKFKGDLDILKFEKSFIKLIERHEILRTNFKINESGDINQYITPEDAFNFKLLVDDVSDQTKQDIDLLILEEHSSAFDLADGLLLRAKLYKVEEQEYVFSLTMHHIIGDGWSMELLISEVISTYNSLVLNNEYDKPKLDIQYKDYTVWLQSELTKEYNKTSEKYWLSQFQGDLPILDLPSFRNRPKVQTYNGNTLTHTFSESFLSKLKEFSKSKDATLFMTLMSGINTLLYRYTNQNDIILGTPIAGRDHPDLEGQIGLYLNTLALRTKIEKSNSFLDVLENQKETLLSAYEHQNYPFDELVNKLNIKRDTSRSALFDVMVVLQNQEQLNNTERSRDLEGIKIEDYEVSRRTSQFDISYMFVEKNGLELSIEYNTDIYDSFLIERMFNHFENLMNNLIDNSNDPILSIAYITKKEEELLLEGFNNSSVDYPKDKTIVDLFESQVEKTPNNIAIVFEDNQLTYSELNEQANQLAHYLRKSYSIHADDQIGLKLERSEQLLVVILGILKSGAAYVPIDINYPHERITYIEKDSNCKTVVDERELEYFREIKHQYSSDNLQKNTCPNDLAYVIYTSGTTGNPKGVMVEHRNVVSIYSDWKEQYELDKFEVNLLQLASVSFDVFVGDICRSLLNGGKMILPSDSIRLNPNDLYELMEKYKVSIFEGTPGLVLPLLNYIKENDKNYNFLKLIIFGSDSFNNQTFNSVRDTFGSSIRIINSYGVTEATIDSSFYDDYNSDFLGTTPIGKPFSNTKIYVLNEEKQLTSTGVFGSVYIGGAGVSRGYYNKPELTASKFTHISFDNEKVYSTGDLARWLPSGNLEFLGRSDFQVKIRGYRIELGEIETIIKQHSREIENVVVAVKEINQEKVLVSYYIANETIDKSKLKGFLKNKLPGYMVPSFYKQLDRFPLTSNGKINRNALPEISGENSIRKKYIAPRGRTETELVAIWEKVLGIEKIGVLDDFFELGGHSLKIVKLKNWIAQKFNVEISFNDLFNSNTIKDQSLKIERTLTINQNDIENNVETEFESFSI